MRPEHVTRTAINVSAALLSRVQYTALPLEGVLAT